MTFWTSFLLATPAHFNLSFFSLLAFPKTLRRNNTRCMSRKRFKDTVYNNHHSLQDKNLFDSWAGTATEFEDPELPFPQKDGAVSTFDRNLHLIPSWPCGVKRIYHSWGVGKESAIPWRNAMSNKLGEMLLSQDLRETLILTRPELTFIWQADMKSLLGIQLPGAMEKENKGPLIWERW